MGTRSLTYINRISKWEPGLSTFSEDTLVCIYRQYDGYPEGMGMDLYNFLSRVELHNGFGSNLSTDKIHCNGPGCLAAQLIHEFKKGIGNVYIHKIAEPWNSWEEYVYTIFVPDDTEDIYIRIDDQRGTLLECHIKDFVEELKNYYSKEEE